MVHGVENAFTYDAIHSLVPKFAITERFQLSLSDQASDSKERVFLCLVLDIGVQLLSYKTPTR